MKNLLYLLVFVTLLLAALAGCTVDTRTVPVTVAVDQEQATALWDHLMVRRAKMFEEMADPATTPDRKADLQRIITSENDLFNILTNYASYSGQQFKVEMQPEDDRGGNVDVQVPR